MLIDINHIELKSELTAQFLKMFPRHDTNGTPGTAQQCHRSLITNITLKRRIIHSREDMLDSDVPHLY
ncbi:hypothetical protein GCM10011410_29770 [Hoyosella rhizosphaerae]|uniref:Uncharacterized protein n=1 Tax=Hoyosella rhizosphaerae TaxID=1755582 RepID=A0A916UIU6_9ACTN|nr:hypothetical protein GCM10011410_29770 [Hoyosella rhizosphaerae]